MTLLKQQAKQEWLSLLVWGLMVGGLIFFTVSLYQSMSESMAQMEEVLKQMPESLRGLYGGNVNLRTLSGYLQAYGFGSWTWIPFLIYTALFAVSVITREVDRRTMEFLLALPVPRWQVVVSRWAGMALALLVLAAVQLLAVWGGVLVLGEQPETGRYLLASLNLWLLMLAVGSIMLVINMFIDDYGRGVGANLGIGLGLFIFHITTESATGAMQQVRNILPLSLYDPVAILGDGLVPWTDAGILIGICAACLGIAVLLFQRKQLAV